MVTPITTAMKTPTLQQGFTMLELMIVVAILAVLAALAAPSFKDTIERVRAESAAEEMTSTIYYARSEAIRRGGFISVRKSCSGPAQEWDCGWEVATDFDGNGSLNGKDEILKTFPALTNMNLMATITTSSASNLEINRWGQANGLGAFGFVISPKPDGVSSPHTRTLCVSSGGRIRVAKAVATCN